MHPKNGAKRSILGNRQTSLLTIYFLASLLPASIAFQGGRPLPMTLSTQQGSRLFESNLNSPEVTTTIEEVPEVFPSEIEAGCQDVIITDNNSDKLALWQRRLITNEDPLSIHKWSALIYTASAITILGTAVVQFGVAAQESSLVTFPSFVSPLVVAFTVSNAIMCVASIRMSFIHRQGDLTARNAFLGTAFSSLFSGYIFLWSSPFAPQALDITSINQAINAVFILLNIYFVLDTVVSIPQVVESRRDRKVELQAAKYFSKQFVRDTLGYVVPIAWGLPVILWTGYQFSYLHDRSWFLEECGIVFQNTGVSFQANICYLNLLASMAASYGSLFVTLRDKKLISKTQELVGISIFSVPAMLWTVYVFVIWYTGR